MVTVSRTGTGTGACDLPRITNTLQQAWSMTSDEEGYRDYEIAFRVEVDPVVHGPYQAWMCPGLPLVGTAWEEFGAVPDDQAFFTSAGRVVQVGREPGNKFFDVILRASTKPVKDCQTSVGQDPVTIPDRIHVRTVNYQTEGTFDRNDDPIVNSAFEQIRGPQNEWDAHRLQVTVEQNVSAMELDVVEGLMHHLNDAEMWGFPARTIKLSAFEVERKYKASCEKYYLRRLTFDIARDFDRCLLDEGTKVLRGKWDTVRGSPTYGQWLIADDEDGPFGKVSAEDPKNFIRYKDWNGENTRVILNGHGVPYDPEHNTSGTADDVAGRICVEYYDSGNLLLLNVPLSIENAP